MSQWTDCHDDMHTMGNIAKKLMDLGGNTKEVLPGGKCTDALKLSVVWSLHDHKK